jgi:dolichol-phosphate mannosyltransferase
MAGSGHAPTPAADPGRVDVGLSVVVPVYGCVACLRPLVGRVRRAAADIPGGYELILVDDRSPDGSWAELRALAAEDPAVRAVRLSRNFGQHAAITAGLAEARGRHVVVMDCDLQDPPEEIPRLYAKAQEGYDVVFARRLQKRHSPARRLASAGYFALMRTFTDSASDAAVGSLSIISRPVVDAFLRTRDRERHYLSILHWLGFSTATIEFAHAERYAGTSSYSLVKLLRHAIDGVFFQTTELLRWITYAAFGLFACGLLLAAVIVYRYLAVGAEPGWTSVAVMLLVGSAAAAGCLGALAAGIARTFEDARDRPSHLVDVVVGRDAPR